MRFSLHFNTMFCVCQACSPASVARGDARIRQEITVRQTINISVRYSTRGEYGSRDWRVLPAMFFFFHIKQYLLLFWLWFSIMGGKPLPSVDVRTSTRESISAPRLPARLLPNLTNNHMQRQNSTEVDPIYGVLVPSHVSASFRHVQRLQSIRATLTRKAGLQFRI